MDVLCGLKDISVHVPDMHRPSNVLKCLKNGHYLRVIFRQLQTITHSKRQEPMAAISFCPGLPVLSHACTHCTTIKIKSIVARAIFSWHCKSESLKRRSYLPFALILKRAQMGGKCMQQVYCSKCQEGWDLYAT